MFELIVAGFMFVALIFYAVTGDADYGGGMWDLLATGPRAGAQRSAIERAIGPIWEADHVWLILIVVILFTGFPPAFAAMMTALNIPFTLMLIGIVLRGSAFIFRKYDIKSEEVKQGWSLLFGAASFFTPFIQGAVLGALSTGQIRIVDGRVVSGFFAGWLTPFALACGLFAVALFAFLAATYLTVDPGHREPCARRFSLARALVRRRARAHCLRSFHHVEGRRASNVSRLDAMVGAAAHRDNARLRDRSVNQSLAATVCVCANRRDRRSDVDPDWLEFGAIPEADYARHHHF